MVRRIDRPPAGLIRVFCPNPEDPPEDQIQVTLRVPTEADRRLLSELMFQASLGAKTVEDKAAAAGMSQGWQKRALEGWVERVENYERYSDEGWVPIATGADLFLHGEYVIVTAVALEVFSSVRLSEDDKKKPEKS